MTSERLPDTDLWTTEPHAWGTVLRSRCERFVVYVVQPSGGATYWTVRVNVVQSGTYREGCYSEREAFAEAREQMLSLLASMTILALT